MVSGGGSWILLRGLTREARHWGGFPARFAQLCAQADGQPVATLDLPGSGREHRQPSPTSVHDIVTQVRCRAADAGLPPPYRLLALSLGGMVATAWAQTHADEVDRLVLINTSMRPYGWPHQRLRWQAWPRAIRLVSCWNDAPACERAIHRLTCANADDMEGDLRQWIAIRRDAPISRRNALRQLLAAARFRAGPLPPRCDTLVLWSAADRLVAPACSAELARRWQCAHAVHPRAGHDLPHDDPDWVAQQVAAWLAGTPATRPG